MLEHWQGPLTGVEEEVGPPQVVKGLAKTIRAMADGSLDSQVGARICNGLGIMRTCLETSTLERIEDRLEQLEGTRGYGDTAHNQPHYRAY